MTRLRHYASNVTSQYGEDGMIAHLMECLDLKPELCVEFGAWDGKYLSNTWHLWAELGWKAMLIEADPQRFRSLCEETRKFGNVIAINAFVGSHPETSLDALLESAEVGEALQILSIDIDGDDYWIWKDIDARAAIVVIEYNASFPPFIEHVPTPGGRTGASASALVRLGAAKGYSMVDLTETNLIMVRNDLIEHLDVDVRPLSEVFDYSLLPQVYSDYDGVHYVVQLGQWGYGGLRINVGRERWAIIAPRLIVLARKHLVDIKVALATPVIRRLRNLFISGQDVTS